MDKVDLHIAMLQAAVLGAAHIELHRGGWFLGEFAEDACDGVEQAGHEALAVLLEEADPEDLLRLGAASTMLLGIEPLPALGGFPLCTAVHDYYLDSLNESSGVLEPHGKEYKNWSQRLVKWNKEHPGGTPEDRWAWLRTLVDTGDK